MLEPSGRVGTRPVAGSIAVTRPVKLVRTSRPPTMAASETTSLWAIRQPTVPSGSIANVSISAWTMRWASRGEPKTAISGDADRCDQRSSPVRLVEPVGVEPVLDDEQPRVVPDEPGRLVVDRRGEADRPGAGRTVDPELRPAELLEVARHERPEILERAAGLRQGEDGRLPGRCRAQRQRARIPPG